jgi:hypothetical protein
LSFPPDQGRAVNPTQPTNNPKNSVKDLSVGIGIEEERIWTDLRAKNEVEVQQYWYIK